ncbi:hypothetical protein NPIL_695941, partial [Nephila pilipes]
SDAGNPAGEADMETSDINTEVFYPELAADHVVVPNACHPLYKFQRRLKTVYCICESKGLLRPFQTELLLFESNS